MSDHDTQILHQHHSCSAMTLSLFLNCFTSMGFYKVMMNGLWLAACGYVRTMLYQFSVWMRFEMYEWEKYWLILLTKYSHEMVLKPFLIILYWRWKNLTKSTISSPIKYHKQFIKHLPDLTKDRGLSIPCLYMSFSAALRHSTQESFDDHHKHLGIGS